MSNAVARSYDVAGLLTPHSAAGPVAVVERLPATTPLERIFSEIYERMAPQMYAIVIRQHGSDVAAEIYQRVMAKLWERLVTGEMKPEQLTEDLIAASVRNKVADEQELYDARVSLDEELE